MEEVCLCFVEDSGESAPSVFEDVRVPGNEELS